MEFWHDSVDDESAAVSRIFDRASRRGRWETARLGDRELVERLQTGNTSVYANGSVNPATGLWQEYGRFAPVGGPIGDVFYLEAE